jgi:hypothetical protein
MDEGKRIMYMAILGGACFLAGNGWISITNIESDIHMQKGGSKRKTRRKKRN